MSTPVKSADMDKISPVQYWEVAIKRYICGDIEALLEWQAENAGPLLNSTMAGIDAAGGCLYEFKKDNSKSRSVQFMKQNMKIPEDAATCIYEMMRCGMFHEGGVKLGVVLKRKNPEKPSSIFWRMGKELYIGADNFARHFINIINTLPSDEITHTPCPRLPTDLNKCIESLDGFSLQADPDSDQLIFNTGPKDQAVSTSSPSPMATKQAGSTAQSEK